jgi:phosphoenolpyruvate carboxylase
MEELSSYAHQAYRRLVYETDGFERYFWESTVVAEIAHLNIGSRRHPAQIRGAWWICGLFRGYSAGPNVA